MRMRDVLWQIWLNCGYFLTVAASGFFLYKLCAPFVRPRNGRFWRVLLFLTLAGSTGMVIWIGDPNLLYTLPAFFALPGSARVRTSLMLARITPICPCG